MKTLHTIYSTFAKHNMAKFLTVLTMLLIVGIGQMWGAETYSWTCSGSTTFSTSGSSLNGVTWKASTSGTSQGTGVSGEKCVQIAKNTGLTLETTFFKDKNITSISIQTWGSQGNTFYLKDDNTQLASTTIPTSYTSNGAKITFSNVGTIKTKLVFNWASASKAFNVRSINITYEDATSSCNVKPTVGNALQSITVTENSIKATIPISAVGGCNITENGLVYSTTNSTPTVGGSGCVKVTTTACGSTAANKTVTITGLNCGTSYYIRGYATNEAGTSYTNVTTKSTSDCPKYTVTLKDDDSTLTQSTAGGSVTLPKREGCAGYTFAGWTSTWTFEQSNWTTTKPTIINAGAYTPTANVNLYPVYTKTEGGGTSYQFQKVTALSQIKAGGTFIITNGSYYLPNAQASSSGPLKADMVEVTNGVVTGAVTDAMKWTFSAADANGKITIKSAANSNYYLYTTNSNGGLRVNNTSDTWTFEEYTVSNILGFAMKSTSNSRYCAVYTDGSDWRSYTTKNATNYKTNSGRLDLYKYTEISSNTTYYISVPDCDPCNALQAPNVTAKNITTNSFTLSWDPVADATSYAVYNFTTDETAEITDLTYTFSGLTPNTAYEWEVEAISATCNGKGTTGTTTTLKAYTITWKNADGTVLETDENVPHGTTPTYNGATPTKTATAQYTYTFSDWSPTIYAADKDQIYTAQFDETTRQYTVTFDANGHGSAPDQQSVDYGTKATEPTAPTAFGYTFGGWYKEAGCTNVWDFATDEVTSDTTLYAKWTAKALTNYRTDCDACIPFDGYAEINGTYHFFPGEKITLTVTPPADADPADCTYQWQKKVNSDYENIDGEIGITYTKENATTSDVGHYRCVVSSEGYCDTIAKYDVKCLQLYVYYDNKSDVFNTPLNRGAEENTATISVDLQNANYTYYFKITDGCGNWYGNTGTMVRDNCTNWPMDVNEYCGLQTTKFGTYVFNVNYSDLAHPTVSVIYPAALQEAGKVIYLDNNVLKWTYSNNADGTNKIYYRIGRSDHNNKIAMDLVPGTANLYKVTTSKYNNFEVWHIANNGCHSEFNSIFKTKTDDKWAATQATAFETLPVTLDAVTVTPTTLRSVGGDNNNNNCEFYNYDITEGMKTWNAQIIPATGGTITVSYTHHDGTAVTNFTSDDRDLAHTCLLTITATPDAGYKLGTLTVNDEAFTSGDVHTLTEDAVIKVTWTEKANPTFAWSAATCTAALEADNTFPTLNNPNSLSPVTYESLNTGVATIDADGNITLLATGTTTIKATGAETDNYKSATAIYTLSVVESNCRWVEVEIGDIEPEDEVLVTMKTTNGTYTLDHSKESSENPPAIAITVNGNEAKYNSTKHQSSVWNISGNATDGYVLYPNGSTSKWLYCTSTAYNVKVGTYGKADNNYLFTIEDNYLKNKKWNVYIGVYNFTDWRHYPANTSNAIAGQTLKFYKRECLDSEHYWVTWDAGEGTWEDGSSKKLESYEVGAPITAPAENPTRVGYEFVGWAPNPTTMPAENTTFTAQWKEVYKITWYENGVPSYTYVPSDNAVVTWEDNIADCGEKKFYGWTTDDTFVSDPTTPPTLISKGTTITGDVTYYAVYADAEEPANPGYEKVTTISEGTYLIATGETENNKAYTGKYPDKRYGGTCEVTVGNSVISTKPTSAVEVEVTLGTGANSGKFAIYDGTYYLSAPDDNELTFNDNIVYDWKLTAEGHINSTGQSARYIQLNSSANPNRFACYSSNQKKAYLYKKQTTTYENFAVSCATYDISVTTPTGGTVTTTPADEAGAGQEITINVTPDDCKYLTALKYNDGSDHSINIASTPYTFTMPAADVTVTATFADKTATDIEVITSAHRLLMQGSSFVGEQVRITYNNGDKETLNWNDSRLTFRGHNTATLGSQTVTVTYNDCGTQSASYNIEVIDGLGITFWDGDYTETIKYEPGDLVDVDSKIGQSICDGWKFVGWSETKVANESNGFTPVHNFNATEPKTLYAVYVQTSTDWISAYNIDELHSGAKYVIVAHYSDSKEYALTNTNNTSSSYLDGANLTTDCEEIREGDAYPYKDRYKLKVNPDENWKWQLVNTGSGWTMRNISANKYLKINSDKTISLTATPDDKFTLGNGDNDSEITAQSSSNNYLSWYNSSKYWNGHTSGKQYYLTNETNFTSTPPCSPLSATFHGNGGTVTDGVNSGDDLTITEPTRDAGITTPTASFEDCNGKIWTFVGWAREEIDVTRVPVLTTDLLHDGGGNEHYNIQEDGEEFWAIFTNTGEPETKYGTITFTDADVTRQYENAKTITKSVTAMGDYDFELYHVSKASSMGIQIDHDNATRGYIKNITSLGKINSISFNDFQTGDIDDVKVYVGNMPNAINTLLTEEDLQQTGNTYTYYPQKNYAYVKIEATGYCGITSISIDFGKGTQIWATTPDCSTITLSGDNVYVTSTNGQSIRATEKLTVKAVQLESKAKVVISSNSSDIYFSDVQDANFTQAVKPTETLTLTTDVDGNLAATEIYVHYRPSVDGTGMPEDVVISANLETPNPSITDDHTIHVRNLPADFVIAAKVNDIWYALPNNCNSTSIVNGLPIDVDNEENPSIATFAPAEAKWGLKPVYTTSGVNDRYGDFGEYFVFAETNTGNAGLLYSNKDNAQVQTQGTYSGISGYTEIPRYEWIPTTTDLTTYQLASAADSKLLSINVNGVFGTHSQLVAENKLRLLPIEEISQHAEMQVVEWREDAVVFMYTGNPTHKVTTTLASTSTTKPLSEIKFDHGVYKMPLSNLLNNEGKSMSIRFYDGSEEVARTEIDVPVIVNSEMNTSSLSTMAKADYETCDVVILNGGKLTASETSGGSQYRFRNVTIYGGGKLVIGEGKYLSMASIILRAGGFANDGTYEYVYPQFELKGTLSNSAGEFKYDYITDNEHWYHLVLPFDGKIKSPSIKYPVEFYGSNVATTNTGSWIVKRYDGATRSTGNYNAWVDIETEGAESITAGKGYIYWGAPKKVTVNGDTQRQKWGIQRIVMSKGADKATEAENANKTIAGLGSYENVANNSDNVYDQGWNLIGNPYMVNLTGLNSRSLKAGQLIEELDTNGNWTGGWVLDSINATLRYITVPSDHFEWYTAEKVSKNMTLVAGRAFFVQIDGTATDVMFEAANRAQLMPALRAAHNDEPVDIETGIVLSNETLQDEVNFWIADGMTNDYEYNADYPKTPNTNNFNIYGVHTNGHLSWVAISPEIAAESMPIGYQVPAAGTYMLSVSEEYYSDEVDALLVTDHEMSPEVTTDLMITSYEFSVNQAETNNKRFTVAIKLKNGDNNDATGLDNLGIGNEHLMKFIYQDKIYILHHGVIYDATGKRVITINK